MKVIDSSFLVAFYIPSDQFHARASTLAKEVANESLLLSDLILFETLTVLNYRLGPKEAKRAYEEITNNSNIVVTNFSDTEKREILAVFFSQIGRKLSVQDCSVIYQARKHNIEPLTFDGGIKL